MISTVISPGPPTIGRPRPDRPTRIIVAAQTRGPFDNLSRGYSSCNYTFEDSINCRIEMLGCIVKFLRGNGFHASDPQSPRSILEARDVSPADVLLYDLDLCEGVDLLDRLGERRPGLAIATSYVEDEDLHAGFFRAGFDVVVAKSELCGTMKAILRGQAIPPSMGRRRVFFNERRGGAGIRHAG